MADFSSYVGLRYLRSKKSNTFLSLITSFSIAGVAIGVSTLIVILSVMDGFEGALKKRLAQGEFHILATRSSAIDDPYFSLSQEQMSKIYELHPDIETVNPVLTTEAILRAGKSVAGATIRGITDPHMNTLAKTLVEAMSGPKVLTKDGVWIGRELADQLDVFPGDKISLISPTETEGPMESVPRMQSFRVDGIYQSGIPEKDLHVLYAPIAAVREFLQKDNVINQLEVQVKKFDESKIPASAVRDYLGEAYLVKDWEQLNAHLFASLKLERVTMFIILTMIIFVASFNIITSLKMTVIEKRKEISILQAMGATPRQIGRIFLVQGAVIGNVGTAIGLVLGLLIAVGIRYYKLELPPIFYDRSIPVEISPLFIAGIVITAVIIVLGAAFFPARSAAKLAPLQGIRDL